MPDQIQQIDEIILFFIQNHCRNPVLDKVMIFLTSLGNGGRLWIFIAIFLLIFKDLKSREKSGIYLITTIFTAMLLGDHILKPLVGRIRPCNQFPEVTSLILCPRTPSFPSGHAMVAFASATVLFYLNRGVGIIAYILASIISFSRIYLFVHYPSDTLGGMIFGVLTAIIIISLLKNSTEKNGKKS